MSENEVDLEQQNVGPASEAGGGEWPSPDTPPTGPSSGEAPAREGDPMAGGRTAEGHGPARSGEGPSDFKDVLEADPVRGGSASTPQDDMPEDREASPDPSAGGP